MGEAGPAQSPNIERQRHDADREADGQSGDLRPFDPPGGDTDETGEQRARNRSDGVDGVGDRRGVPAVGALKQASAERKRGAEQRARDQEKREDQTDLLREEQAEVRPGGLADGIHPPWNASEEPELQRRRGPERDLELAEAGQGGPAGEEACGGQAPERDPEQVDAQHGGEGIDRRAEHQTVEPHPGDLEGQRRESCQPEQHGENAPRALGERGLVGRLRDRGRRIGRRSVLFAANPGERGDRDVQRDRDGRRSHEPHPRDQHEPAEDRIR